MQDYKGTSPLMSASLFGRTEIALLLLRYKANANAKNAGGFFALSTACQNGHSDIVSALLSNGADVNMKGRVFFINDDNLL